jgi:hypothetical protein
VETGFRKRSCSNKKPDPVSNAGRRDIRIGGGDFRPITHTMTFFTAVRISALALALLCAGCGKYEGTYTQATVTGEANIYPANYRADTIAFLKSWLNDTSNIRDASISEPALRSAGRVERYVLCVRFNARNSAGQYEGAKDRMVVFLAGRLDTIVEARRDECTGAKYQPFPELERLAR